MAGDKHESALGRIGRSLRRDRVAAVATVGVVGIVAVAALGLAGPGHTIRPTARDIGAWLTNDGNGSVSHINGLAGRADSRVPLLDGRGHALTVIQDGDTVLVQDLTTGLVSRIDPAQLTVSQTVSYGSPGVRIVARGSVGYVVDPTSGQVQRVDPVRLSVVGRPIGLTAPLGEPGIADDGTLWVPTPATGSVVPVKDGVAGPPVVVGEPGDALILTIAAGTPVITNAVRGIMVVLSVAGGRSTVNLPVPAAGLEPRDVLAPAVTEGPVVALMTGADQLVVVDTQAGTPTAVTLVATGGDQLGAPQVLSNRVYIPNRSTGRLIVYDIAAGALADEIAVSPPGGDLRLLVKDGQLWVNDARGPDAVCVDADGAVHHIGKYEMDMPGDPLQTPGPTVPAAGGAPQGQPGDAPQGHPGDDNPGTGSTAATNPTAAPPRSTPSPIATPTRTTPAPPPPPPPLPPMQAPASVTEQPQAGAILVRFSPTSSSPPRDYSLGGAPAGARISPTRVPPGGPYQFTVTGLDCAARYTFTVLANYPAGSQSASAGSAARPCVAPKAPANLHLAANAQHQLGATWAAPPSDGGGAVRYTVSWGATPVAGLTTTSYTITRLTNFRTYTVTVTATNPAGSSQPPATVSAAVAPGSTWSGTIANDWTLPLNVRQRANTSSASVGGFPAGGGQHVDVICRTPGGAWADPTGSPTGSDWLQIRAPAGYVAAGYVTTSSAVWSCT